MHDRAVFSSSPSASKMRIAPSTPPPEKPRAHWIARVARSPYLLIALAVHLLLGIGFGSKVILHGVPPKTAFQAGDLVVPSAAEAEKPPAPLPETPPDQTVPVPTAQVSLPDVVASDVLNPDTFQLPAAQPTAAASPAAAAAVAPPAPVQLAKVMAKTAPKENATPFGTLDDTTAGLLTGHLYDLKQMRDGKPSAFADDAANGAYHLFLKNEIVGSGSWNVRALDAYYKVEAAMGAGQVFVPNMQALAAPALFNVADKVKAKRWIILYEGAFVAPADGDYRFAGVADDILVVSLNQRTVLDGSLTPVTAKVKREAVGTNTGVGSVWGGEWFHLREGDRYPLRVLIGEEPGGLFSACLFIQEKGKDYPQRPGNKGPVLPLFQLQPTALPDTSQPERTAPTVADTPFLAKQGGNGA